MPRMSTSYADGARYWVQPPETDAGRTVAAGMPDQDQISTDRPAIASGEPGNRIASYLPDRAASPLQRSTHRQRDELGADIRFSDIAEGAQSLSVVGWAFTTSSLFAQTGPGHRQGIGTRCAEAVN